MDHEDWLFRWSFIENFELGLKGWKGGRGFHIRARKAQSYEKYQAGSWVIVTIGVTRSEDMEGSNETWADSYLEVNGGLHLVSRFLTPELPLGEMDQESEWCHLKNIGQGLEYLRAFLDLVNGFAHFLCRGCWVSW